MYFQPYGNGQQLNLNWIINEIIELHKQLDPDYETPSFSQIYPYSNLNQLNLDWILSELKTLKELAPEPTPELDIQAVAEALVALPFDSTKSYQIFDYISRDGEIWRATEAIAAGSAWDGSKWFKTKIGTDLAVLERWINAINASLTTLENTVDELSSADISDDSDAGGATVKASLNNLKGSLNAIEGQFAYLGNISGADIKEAAKNACIAFNAKGYSMIPCPVGFTWTGHEYIIGTMQKFGTNINYTINTAYDAYYGAYNSSTDAVALYGSSVYGKFYNIDAGTFSGSDESIVEQAMQYALTIITDSNADAFVTAFRSGAWAIVGVCRKRGNIFTGHFFILGNDIEITGEISNGTFSARKLIPWQMRSWNGAGSITINTVSNRGVLAYGYMQGIGEVLLSITHQNGTVNPVLNLLSGTVISNSAWSFTSNSNSTAITITYSGTNAGINSFAIMKLNFD